MARPRAVAAGPLACGLGLGLLAVFCAGPAQAQSQVRGVWPLENGSESRVVARVPGGLAVLRVFASGLGGVRLEIERAYRYEGETLAVVDLDGDGKPDVVAGGSPTFALGPDGAPKWRLAKPCRALFVGNFVGDAKPELLCHEGPTLALFDGTGQFVWRYQVKLAGQPQGLRVEDFDGDGRLDVEFAIGGTVFRVSGKGEEMSREGGKPKRPAPAPPPPREATVNPGKSPVTVVATDAGLSVKQPSGGLTSPVAVDLGRRRRQSRARITASVEGFADAAQVKQRIEAQAAPLLACYEKQIRADPLLGEGKVRIELTVPRSGKPQDSLDYTTLNHPATQTCLRKAARGLRLPRPALGEGKIGIVLDAAWIDR